MTEEEYQRREREAGTSVQWFRVESGRYAGPVDEWGESLGRGRCYVEFYEFRFLRKTPRGAWIDVWGKPKFILDGARKRWACPTKQEALESFLARKKRQALILSRQMDDVKEASMLAERMYQEILDSAQVPA